MSTMQCQLTYEPQSIGNGVDRESLIIEHLQQVKWIATRLHERMPESTNLEDLISIGVIGLIQCAFR